MTDDLDGVKFNWNVLPSTRLEASQLSTPIGCLYTPFHTRDTKYIPIPYSKCQPLVCPECDNYINVYAKIDRANKMWWCPFCETRTSFPPDYVLPPQNPSSDDEIPVEFRQSSSTIVYELPNDISSGLANPPPLAYVFMIDAYQNIDDVTQFEKLITRVVESIEVLPEGSLVSVITYEENVKVHNISNNTSALFSYEEVFGANYNFEAVFQDESLKAHINKTMKITPNVPYDWEDSPLVKNGIFTQLSAQNSPMVLAYIRNLASKITHSYKPLRATGLAHYIATYLLSQASFKGFIGKVSVFINGPGTINPGCIVDPRPGAKIRSHNDIVNLEAQHFVSSSRFYEVLGIIATGCSIEEAATSSNTVNIPEPLPLAPRFSFDVYSCSLDQVGLYEMKSMISSSSGQFFLCESFHSYQFKNALARSITKASTKYNCKLTVATSRGAKVHKLVGHGSPLPSYYQQHPKLSSLQHERISDSVTEFDCSTKKTSITNQWWFNSLGEDTLAVFFDIDTVSSSSKLHSFTGVKHIYIQFRLKYWDDSCWKLRVTTVMKPTTLFIMSNHQVRMTDGSYRLINSKSKIVKERELLASFDYKAWIILLARLLINKIDSSLGFGDFKTVVKQADNTLIRLLHYFGGISIDRDNEGSFNPYENIMTYYKINENFERLPSLMYHLRRNPQLINVFNSSPDETAYYHYWFLKANTECSIAMIEPRTLLIENDKCDVVQPDSQLLTIPSPENKVLVMDSIFNVIIYYYSSELVLHPSDNEELIYGNNEKIKPIMQLIKNQQQDKRQVEPRYVLTKKGHSQARFLVARLSPQSSYTKKDSEGFFGALFKKLSFEDSAFRYNTIKTDEISIKEYYDGLIKMVKGYRVEHDY